MSWAAVIAAGAAVAGSVYQSQQGKKAGDKSAAGAQAGIDEQRRQFDLIMGMLAPSRGLGNQATNALARLYGYKPTMPMGYGPATTAAPAAAGSREGASFDARSGQINLGGSKWSPSVNVNPLHPVNALTMGLPIPKKFADKASSVLDPIGIFGKKKKKKKPAETIDPNAALMQQNMLAQQQFDAEQAALPQGIDVFQASPDYNFRRDEGMRGIENSFSARGGAQSGNALRALADFNSNLASGEFGNFVNRQLALAGMGQAATNQAVTSANYTGGNVANLLGQQANARASGIVDRTNAITGGLNDLASIYGNWMRNRQGNNTYSGMGLTNNGGTYYG